MRPKRDEIAPRFLYYYMLSPQWKVVIASKTVLGATVNRIPIAAYPDFPIMIPDLETQRRIAGVLSSYDKLIESNRNQIKLLEEAAQRLSSTSISPATKPLPLPTVSLRDGRNDNW